MLCRTIQKAPHAFCAGPLKFFRRTRGIVSDLRSLVIRYDPAQEIITYAGK